MKARLDDNIHFEQIIRGFGAQYKCGASVLFASLHNPQSWVLYSK